MFQGLLDLDESRGHAMLHAMQVASIGDANIKLLRRKSVRLRGDFAHSTVANGSLPTALPLLGLKALWRGNRSEPRGRRAHGDEQTDKVIPGLHV